MSANLRNRGLRARGKGAAGHWLCPSAPADKAGAGFSLSRGLYATDRLVNESLNDRIPPPRAAVFGPTATASIQLPGVGRSHPSQVDLAALAGMFWLLRPIWCPALTQRSPWAGFTTGPIPIPFNLSRRRLCNPLGRSLGCAAHCCAISVARARAALTATLPRSIRSSARRTTVGAPKSRSLVNFMIRPPAFGWWSEPHPTNSDNTTRSRPSHGPVRCTRRDLGAGTSIPSRRKETYETECEPDQDCNSGKDPDRAPLE